MGTITVRVQKTVQVKSFEPVVVDLSQTVEVSDKDAPAVRLEIYKALTKDVEKFINNEIRKGRASKEEDE